MPESAFDPYDVWLGIPPSEQPADYYRLLGINRFENNQEVIANAVQRQTRHIESFKAGANASEAERLLNKLATASACLSDVAKKRVYDRAMSGIVAPENSPPVAADAPMTRSPQSATTRPRPRTRGPLVEVATIVLGGVAGLVIGNAILWYGFGIDVLGVMKSHDEGTATPLAQIDPGAPSKPALQDENRLAGTRGEEVPGTDVRPDPVAESTTDQSEDSVSSAPVPDELAESEESTTVPSPSESLMRNETPLFAFAPFDAEQARRYQQVWADHLGIPVEFTNSIGMRFRLLPPGEFQMGDPDPNQTPPLHTVQFAKPFYVSVFETTQSEYLAVTKTNPSSYAKTGRQRDVVKDSDTSRLPVENVSWIDAKRFCEKLSTRSDERQEKRLYRLATEAQWEYACRAGTTTRFSFGDRLAKDQASFGQGGATTRQPLLGPRVVGSFPPNAFGLFDMHGNVW